MSPSTSIAPTSKLIKPNPTVLCTCQKIMLLLLLLLARLIDDVWGSSSSSAYVKHSVTTCGSKCNFNYNSSTFTILSTLFSLNSFVVTTIYIYTYIGRGSYKTKLHCALPRYTYHLKIQGLNLLYSVVITSHFMVVPYSQKCYPMVSRKS